MEGDDKVRGFVHKHKAFQSTPSVWRETHISNKMCSSYNNFNPLPPYGGRQFVRVLMFRWIAFQSTPSVWRETGIIAVPREVQFYFNPLPPYGGRPDTPRVIMPTDSISIHSLRMEGDNESRPQVKRCGEFQSTPSVWRETTSPFCISTFSPFQSTPSVWRETLTTYGKTER